MSVRVDTTSMTACQAPAFVRYLSGKECVIRTVHNSGDMIGKRRNFSSADLRTSINCSEIKTRIDGDDLRTDFNCKDFQVDGNSNNMKAIYSGYEPMYGRIPSSVYSTKSKIRVEKKVRFALDFEENTDNICICHTSGADTYNGNSTQDLEPRKSPKSRFDSYYDRKLKDSANGSRSTNGLTRETSFTVTTTAQKGSRALAEGLARKHGSESAAFSPRSRLTDVQAVKDCTKHTPTRVSLQTVVSPEFALGARTFTTLLDDVLKDKTYEKDISRFSRYRPVGAYSTTRVRESHSGSPKVHSARTVRYPTATSLRNGSNKISMPLSLRSDISSSGYH